MSILFSLCTTSSSLKNPISYSQKYHIIDIDAKGNSFSERGNIAGVLPLGEHQLTAVYFGEMETLHKIEASYLAANGKWKNIKSKNIVINNTYSSSFYTGYKKATIVFPKQEHPIVFKYQFTKQTKQLKWFSGFSISNKNPIEDFSLEINLDNSFELEYSMDSLALVHDIFEFQKKEKIDINTYTFTTKQDVLTNLDEDKRIGFRCSVSPKGKDAYDDLNDWYFRLSKENSYLNPETIAAIEKMVANQETELGKIKTLFKEVKNHISYIDFENGIGAIQPRDPNKIWTNKQGDCKDMSNLLCQSLKHLGIDAYLALSATIGHHYDFDFPSMSSANHVICAVNHNNKWYYLDATEKEGEFGHPSRQIQNRSIFIINTKEGELHKIKAVDPLENRVHIQMDLKQMENDLAGPVKFEFQGLSKIQINQLKNYSSKEKTQQFISSHIESYFDNAVVKEVDIGSQVDTCTLKANIKSSRKVITHLKNKAYLSLNFLPYPHSFERSIEDNKILTLGRTAHQEIEVRLKFDYELKLQPNDPVVFEKEGMVFKFQTSQASSNSILIKYSYINNQIIIDEQLAAAYNEINTIIEKNLTKTLIYEIQSKN